MSEDPRPSRYAIPAAALFAAAHVPHAQQRTEQPLPPPPAWADDAAALRYTDGGGGDSD